MRIESIYTLKEEYFNYLQDLEKFEAHEVEQVKATLEIFISFLQKEEFSLSYVKGVKNYLIGGVPETSVKFRALNHFYNDIEAFSAHVDKQKMEFEESIK